MLAPLADPSDVAEIWRPLKDAEVVIAARRIDQASADIRIEFPDIDSRIAANPSLTISVAGVVADMVLRVMQNPNKVRTRTVSIDDFSRSETTDNAASSGELYITDRERAVLRGRRRSRAFTIIPAARSL